jgi:hypothetical protein
MSTNAISIVKRWDWRTIVFTVLAGLAAYLFMSNVYRLTAPWASLAWLPKDDPRQLNPELHRWHTAMWGAVSGILNGGVLLSLLWRPRQKLLLIQYIAVMVIVAAPIMLPFEPSLLVVILMVALVVATYPAPRTLLDFSQDEPLSRPLLAFCLVAAVLLVPYMVRLELWQIQGVGGEHATANQWVSDVEHTAFLLLALFLASTKRPGWRTLGILTGAVFIYLGVAALALPNYAGSWGITGGITALIGGLLYIVATIREARKTVDNPSEALPSVAS